MLLTDTAADSPVVAPLLIRKTADFVWGGRERENRDDHAAVDRTLPDLSVSGSH